MLGLTPQSKPQNKPPKQAEQAKPKARSVPRRGIAPRARARQRTDGARRTKESVAASAQRWAGCATARNAADQLKTSVCGNATQRRCSDDQTLPGPTITEGLFQWRRGIQYGVWGTGMGTKWTGAGGRRERGQDCTEAVTLQEGDSGDTLGRPGRESCKPSVILSNQRAPPAH